MGNRILFIGAGNMAEALIAGLLQQQVYPKEAITAVDVKPELLQNLGEKYGINTSEDAAGSITDADVILLCVKPQAVDNVLQQCGRFIDRQKLLITIAAGKTIDSIAAKLSPDCRIVRVMPNTPALVGSGAAGIAPGGNCTRKDLDLAVAIFDSVGISVVVDEKLINTVTGLSGSAPAYVYLFIDALADAGVRLGLTKDQALQLAAATVAGSGKMVLETKLAPAILKDKVTSPGGTTAAALFELELGGFKGLVMSAVEAAKRRADELG